jgi:FkbM family methyltransferase
MRTKTTIPLANRLLSERLAFWQSHPLIGDVPIVLACEHKPFVMSVKNDDTVAKSLYWDGFLSGWEPHSLQIWSALAARARCAIDIGSYTGIYALLAAASSAARVYGFEPLPENYARFVHNVRLNGLEGRITPVRAALSSSTGTITLYTRYAAPGILSTVHSVVPNGGAPLEVPCVSLDQFVVERSIHDVDLVKIDVETAEPLVLEGMGETLGTAAPDVLIEATSTSALREIWRRFPHAYRCFAVDDQSGTTIEVRRGGVLLYAGLRFAKRAFGQSRGSGNRNFLFSARPSTARILEHVRASAKAPVQLDG